MASPPAYFVPQTPHPGPVQDQGMSPTLTEGLVAARSQPVSFGPRQMPVGYSSVSTRGSEGQGLANGVTSYSGGPVTSSGHDISGVGSRDDPNSEAAGRPARARTGSDDGTAMGLGVEGRVEHRHSITSPATTPHSTPHQLPHPPHTTLQQQEQSRTSALTSGTDEGARVLRGESYADMSPGTRLSVEAHRAMAQLSSQRTALVQALQQRASRSSFQDEGLRDQAVPSGEPLPSEGANEEVVWYSRLQGFLRRRVVEPVREQVENLRRSSPITSPQSTWISAPSSPDQILEPSVRQAMQRWTEQRAPLLDRPLQPEGPSGEGLSESAVQEEVRRQAQGALQRRDQHVQALQVENSELRQVVQELLHAGLSSRGAVPVLEGEEQGSVARLLGPESSGNSGNAASYREARQGEPRVVPAVPNFGSHGDQGHPPEAVLQSRRDQGHPHEAVLQSRRDQGHPHEAVLQSRRDQGHLSELASRSRGVPGLPPGLSQLGEQGPGNPDAVFARATRRPHTRSSTVSARAVSFRGRSYSC